MHLVRRVTRPVHLGLHIHNVSNMCATLVRLDVLIRWVRIFWRFNVGCSSVHCRRDSDGSEADARIEERSGVLPEN